MAAKNVPLEMIRLASKQGREYLELLAAHTKIKFAYGSSAVKGVSVKRLQDVLGIGRVKAVRMLWLILRTPELFRVKNGRIVAKNIKIYKRDRKNAYHNTTSKHRKFYHFHNSCYEVVRKVKDGTLKDILNQLREALISQAIYVLVKKESVIKDAAPKGTKNGVSTDQYAHAAVRLIASITGISKSTCCRLLKKLVGEGKLKKESAVLHYCPDTLILEDIKENSPRTGVFFCKKGGYWVESGQYAFGSLDFLHASMNCIYNHEKRQTRILSQRAANMLGAYDDDMSDVPKTARK